MKGELNDPQHFNTLSLAMGRDMQLVLRQLAFISPRKIVLQGKGPHFCAGGNPYSGAQAVASSIAGIAAAANETIVGFIALRALSSPIVTAVHGTLVGGATAVCLSADVVVASEDATFQHGNLPRGRGESVLSAPTREA
jgi:2-(1,2-epoxy-1,2-dihydrophenyl)acetyl-CoA isomerase